jgi:hypothetical protein
MRYILKCHFFWEKLNKQVNCTEPRTNALHNHVVPSDQLKAYLVQACQCEGNYNLLKKKFKYKDNCTAYVYVVNSCDIV